MKPFLITTAIDYPNGPPHIGHLYEKLIADTYARWHRWSAQRNSHHHKEVFFLTGTDENGQKLQKAAAERGDCDVKGFVDEHVQQFQDLCERAYLSHTDFIRTTESRHQRSVQKMWQQMRDAGDIYKGEFSGLYCYSCEQFYPPSQIDISAPQCPIHKIPLGHLAEEGYFFKLSRYGEAIKKHLKDHPNFIFPPSAYEEMISRVCHEDLHDLPVSRVNKGWGIEVPDDPSFVIYTWFDALFNYITPIVCEQMPPSAWPADIHVIGKDINWFHSVIWPAMLMSLGLDLPQKIMVHGMILDGDGKKMSKSTGNIICPHELLNIFCLDTIRAVFLKTISSGKDGKVSVDLIRQVHNNELANDLGNLVSRLIKLAIKKSHRRLSCDPITTTKVQSRWSENIQKIAQKMNLCQHHQAFDILWQSVGDLNVEMNLKKPWSLDSGSEELMSDLGGWMLELFFLADLLSAFLPDTSKTIKTYLGAQHRSGRESYDFCLSDPEPLFARMS